MRAAGLLFLALTFVFASDLVCEGSLASTAPALTCCGSQCPAPSAGSGCCKVSRRPHQPPPTALSPAKLKIGSPAIVGRMALRTPISTVIHNAAVAEFVPLAP